MVKALLLCLIMLFSSLPVSSQPHLASYNFTVEQEIATCDIQADGSAWIYYNITFRNYATIDYVDIGMPNKYYNLSTASAELYIDTSPIPLSGIEKSTVIAPGYQIPIPKTYQNLPRLQIVTKCKVDRMVYPDTENASYASVEFYPTWWGSFCHDIEFLQTTIVFPPAVTDPNSTKWHHQTPDWMRFENGRIKFTWNSSGNYEHKYGVSFPRSAVSHVFEPDKPEPWAQFLGNFMSFFISISFICCNYAPLTFALVFLAVIFYTGWKNKMQYLPPSVGVEGMGIRYGLTAPEAAVLLNVPLNKLVNMVYFGMYRKGIIAVESRSPLRLRVLRTDYEGLQPYEIGFRAAIKPDGSVDEEILKDAVVQMIKDVETKIRGFSRKETANYYRKIIERAWEQVKNAQMDDEKLKILEENFEWLYADDKFERGVKKHYSFGFYRVPVWYPFFYPRAVYVHSYPRAPGQTPSSQPPSLPKLPGSEFANQIVSGIQNSANQFVKNLTAFTSHVTAVTNPAAVATKGFYGCAGGGCACACACAGCACACAGGGR